MRTVDARPLTDSDLARDLFNSDLVNITPETIATLNAPAQPLEGAEVAPRHRPPDECSGRAAGPPSRR